VPSAVKEIIIDPSEALLDINRLNNSSNCLPKIDFYFMKNQRFMPPADAYLWETWPGLFYNDIDKFKIGLANYAGYLNKEYLLTLKTWYKTKTNDIDFQINFKHPLYAFNRAVFNTQFYRLDGRQGANARVLLKPSDAVDFILNIDHYKMFDSQYVLYPWQDGVVNTVNFNIQYQTTGNQSQSYAELKLKNSLAGSENNFSLARLDFRQSFYSRYTDYVLELNLSAGAAAKNTPLQEKFNLAGANGVAEFQDEYYRARGTLPVSWRRNGHLYKNEFASVRGVSLISDNYINNNIWAASINFSFPNIFTYADISFLDFFDNAIFFDAGTVWTGKVRPINKAAKSAGVSIAFHNFYDLNYIFGLEKINFDFPLWIEQPGSMKNKDEFHWLISFEFKLDRNLVF